MSYCLNKNALDYQLLQLRSGLPDYIISAYCTYYQDKYNRFPYLDEILGVDSSISLSKDLNIKDKGCKTQNILDKTGTSSISEANISINNSYRDLEVELTQIQDETYVEITRRPTKDGNVKTKIEPNLKINSKALLTNIITKLGKLYGINFINTSIYEIEHSDLAQVVPNASSTNAFVYNGLIYINTDVAKTDAPIHELLHLFMGSIKFQDPNLYQNLLQAMTEYSGYQTLAELFLGRTLNDIAEEILVKEYSKYLTDLPSIFDNMDSSLKYNIIYNINRVLDTILMGDKSVASIQFSQTKNMNLLELSEKVNSALCNNTFLGSLTENHIHRILMNTKKELIKLHKLLEICN